MISLQCIKCGYIITPEPGMCLFETTQNSGIYIASRNRKCPNCQSPHFCQIQIIEIKEITNESNSL